MIRMYNRRIIVKKKESYVRIKCTPSEKKTVLRRTSDLCIIKNNLIPI